MAKKLIFKEVYDRFKEEGCELLETIYDNSHTLMRYKCKCNNMAYISLDNFRSGARCNKCGIIKQQKNRRFSQDKIKNIFKKNNCILFGEYKNSSTKIKYQCSCGNISERSLDNFKKRPYCKKCANKYRKPKYSYEYVKKYFHNEGCILLTTFKDYKNVSSKLEYICTCKNKSITTFSVFKNGHRCRKCAIIKFSEKVKGKKHWNYNPNLTGENRREKFYNKNEARQWSKAILKRDKYVCQCCGKNNRYLNAHHIVSFCDNKEISLDIDNGITLCAKGKNSCHKLFHKNYGFHCTKEQLDEFIKNY